MRKKTNRNKRVPVAVLCAAAMGIFSAGAVTPMWLRDVKISPDGSTIAFTYKGGADRRRQCHAADHLRQL